MTTEQIKCSDCGTTIDIPLVVVNGREVWEYEPVGWILAWSVMKNREVLLCGECSGETDEPSHD